MKHAIVLFASICIFKSVSAQSADSLFLRTAFIKLERARDYTLSVARLMPAEKYGFKPSHDQMTFAGQLLHLSANLGWLSSSYLKNNGTNPVAKDDMTLNQKDAVIAVVEKSYRYALDALKTFHPDGLGDSVSFFAGPMQKMQIINLMNDHQSHHRGQMIVYLRLNGIAPPAYVGW